MDLSRITWPASHIGRRTYFICLGLMLVLFVFHFWNTIPPASLLLFMGRARDAGEPRWWLIGLIIVGIELFLGPIGRWALDHAGRTATGYGILALVLAHVAYAIALGVQRPKAVAL